MSTTTTATPLRPNVAEIARRLGVTPQSVGRWITHGSRPARRSGKKAKSIRLAATRLPGGWAIREEDLEAFQAQLTEAWISPTVADTLEPPRERDRRLDREIERLKVQGLI